jgi:hypothetical protein
MMLSRTAKSRGPGAPTLALNLRKRTAGDGGKKARSPGRSRISRNTIVQGMPVDAVYPWLLTPVLFFCTGGHGCNAHPAFPAPSVEKGGTSRIKTRANHAARSRGCGCNLVAGPSFETPLTRLLRMRSFHAARILNPRGEEARKRRLWTMLSHRQENHEAPAVAPLGCLKIESRRCGVLVLHRSLSSGSPKAQPGGLQ